MRKSSGEERDEAKIKGIAVHALKRSDMLRLKPTRSENIAWKVDEDGLVMIESKQVGLIARLLGMLFRFRPRKRIQLDELGSIVWQMCDGEHTIREIAQELIKRYKLERHEAEVSLITFIQQLIKRRLITLPLTSSDAKPAEDA